MIPGFDVPEVRAGDKILPAWRALQRAEQAGRVELGKSVRRRQMPNGVALTCDVRGSQFPHPWKASLTGLKVNVRPGMLDVRVPVINGVALDAEIAPQLDITGEPPNDALRSFVCLQITVDPASGLADPEDPESLQIIHTSDLSSSPDLQVSESSSIGLHPLAMIKWRDTTTPTAIFQVAYHNLQHRFYRATSTQSARHVFWPA